MVKTTEVLAIAGGVAVIGGVLAYSILKSKGLTPLQTSQTPPSPPTGSPQVHSVLLVISVSTANVFNLRVVLPTQSVLPITCARMVLVFLRYSAEPKVHLVTQNHSAVLDIPVSTAYARVVLLVLVLVPSSGTLCLVRANPLFQLL